MKQKHLLSMKLRRKEHNAFDIMSSAHSEQEQLTAGSLGIVKKPKYESREHDEIAISNKVII